MIIDCFSPPDLAAPGQIWDTEKFNLKEAITEAMDEM
jgi:hypothetical protein